jgi:hypothetical protein
MPLQLTGTILDVAGDPWKSREVIITSLSTPTLSGSSVVATSKKVFVTKADGTIPQLTAEGGPIALLPGDYKVDLGNADEGGTFNISVLASSGTADISTLISGGNVFVPNGTAYTVPTATRAALQATIDAAYNDRVNCVLLPHQLYECDAKVRLYPGLTLMALRSSFQGLVASNCIVQYTGTAGGTLIGPNDSSVATENLRLLGIAFDGGANASTVIDWTRVGYSLIEGCQAYGSRSGAYGLIIDDQGASRAYKNTVYRSRFAMASGAANISLRGNATSGANYNTFQSLFVGYAVRGIEINQYCSGTLLDDITFQGISGVDKALYCNGTKTTIRHSFFEDCTTGIYVDTAGTLDRNNLRWGGNITNRIIDNGNSSVGLYSVPDDADPTSESSFIRAGRFILRQILKLTTDGEATLDTQPISSTGSSIFSFFKNTNVSGIRRLRAYKGDGSTTLNWEVNADTGDVGIGGKIINLSNSGQLRMALASVLEFVAGSGGVHTLCLGPNASATGSYLRNTSGLLEFLVSDGSAYCELKGKGLTLAPPVVTTTAINFAASSTIQTITLSGATTFTTSNRTVGRRVTVYVTCDGTNRALTFPSWKWVGTAPTTALANITYRLELLCTDANDTGVYATWQ